MSTKSNGILSRFFLRQFKNRSLIGSTSKTTSLNSKGRYENLTPTSRIISRTQRKFVDQFEHQTRMEARFGIKSHGFAYSITSLTFVCENVTGRLFVMSYSLSFLDGKRFQIILSTFPIRVIWARRRKFTFSHFALEILISFVM